MPARKVEPQPELAIEEDEDGEEEDGEEEDAAGALDDDPALPGDNDPRTQEREIIEIDDDDEEEDV